MPFYVALPGPTIDWSIERGSDVPIEQRGDDEVTGVAGRMTDGAIGRVTVTPRNSPVANYAFDVTPAKYVTALITERGVCEASQAGLRGLYPDKCVSPTAPS